MNQEARDPQKTLGLRNYSWNFPNVGEDALKDLDEMGIISYWCLKCAIGDLFSW